MRPLFSLIVVDKGVFGKIAACITKNPVHSSDTQVHSSDSSGTQFRTQCLKKIEEEITNLAHKESTLERDAKVWLRN